MARLFSSDTAIPGLSIGVFSVLIMERDDSPEPRNPARVQVQPCLAHANIDLTVIEDGIPVCAGPQNAARAAHEITEADSRISSAPAAHSNEPRIKQE